MSADMPTRRVRDLLERPLLTCPVKASVRDAARLMVERDADAIVVTDGSGAGIGIITDADLRRFVAAGGAGETLAEAIMSRPLITVEADAFIFEAIHTMLRHRLHHLVVIDRGRPSGVIADGDLMAARAQGPLFVARRIDQAQTLDQLVALGPAREQAIRVLHRGGLGPYDLGRIMAETNDHLVQRALALVEAEIGPPPVAYCWIGVGSEGRREQSLKTDQDNGLVYDDPPDHLAAEARRYFGELASRVVDALERCGLPRCAGDVMASNPRWRQPLQTWRGYFARWVRDPEPAALLNASIFFDLRAVAGDGRLVERLWSDLLEWIPQSPLFIQLLTVEAVSRRPPLGFFRGFVVEGSGEHRGGFDIKARGLLPVVEAARVFSLARGITVTNTVDRLRALRDQGAINRQDADDLVAAYEFLMDLRISHHLADLAIGDPLDDYIVPDRLSRVERNTLREHFKVISELQSCIQSELPYGLGS